MLKSILPKVLIRRHTKSQIRYSSTTSAFEKYDLCILGGGPGGFAAAMRAADYGQKVCVINKGRFGGAGLWDGALASKTMWEMAGKYIVYRRMALGLTATRKDSGDFSPIRWLKMNNMVDKILLEREDQMVRQLTASTVKIVDGYGQFTSPNEIKVESSHGDSQTILADKFLIATGSRPREHPTVKADGKYILTSDHISNMQRFPDSLVILGAGVIGCEYATIFSKFKQTKVFMIDRSERILPFEDADISRSCVANFRRRDVTIHEKCSLDSMQVVDGGVRYVVRDNVSGRKKTVHTQAALMSIGRVPNIDNIGLENTGVKLTDNGLIDAREFVGTSVPHIAVCGDANAQMSLVNVAENSARYAVHKFFAPKSKSRRPHFLNEKGNVCAENVSKIMFLDPEIAAVGINETDAQAAGIAYRCAVYSFSLVSRAMAMSETNGCIKLLVSNDKHMRILGIRVAGPHASSLIEVVSLMVRYRRSIKDLSELLTAYPAVTEGLMECVRLLLGSSMFKPSVFSDQARVFEWSPGDPLTTQGPCYD